MLTVEYLKEHGVYIVTPVIGKKIVEEFDYIFAEASEVRDFANAWYINPSLAHFVYNYWCDQKQKRSSKGE